MNIEFLVNGTPFHYGALMASYMPNVVASELPPDGETYRHSQLPHVIINPALNSPVKITAPYVSDFAWMDLSIANSSHVGVIYFDSLTALQMANLTPTTNVTVSVFAYLTDVELTLTSNVANASFTSQVGRVEVGAGEYGITPISKVASAVASAAGALVRVPMISPFAKATEMAANAISGIATIFGYSSPLNLQPVSLMKPAIASNFATTSDLDSSRPLSLDPKNELSVDSRLIGLDGTDELAIANIATIPCFIKNIAWSTADAADTVLGWFPVTPYGIRVTSVTGGSAIVHTPAAAIARMFTHWSGTMKYHMQIVSSQYHRGRLRITYIPGGYSGGTFDPSIYNENYSQIVDITSDADFAFAIGYVARMGYLNCNSWTYGASTTYDPHSHNGSIVVSVVNSLVAPLALQDINLLIWASAHEDMRFAGPRDLDYNLSYYTPQVGSTDPDCCSDVVYHDLVPYSDRSDLDLAYYGESVASLRVLLKRDCYWSRLPATTGNSVTLTGIQGYATIPRMPLMFGYAPAGHLFYHQTTTAVNFNYTRMIPLTFITGWFLGNKGSVRHKVVINGFDNASLSTYVSRYDYNSSTVNSAGLRQVCTATSYPSVIAQNALSYPEFSGYSTGVSIFPDKQVAEVQIPDYNPILFHTPTDDIRDEEISCGALVAFDYVNRATATDARGYTLSLPIFTSVGEDFNCFFFRGIPTLYAYTSIPAASATYSLPSSLF